MHFWRILSISLGCCLCSTLTSSENPESTLVRKVNELLLDSKNDGVLLMCLLAASAGKNFFSLPGRLSEDCVRTATFTINFAEKPSMFSRTKPVINQAAVNSLKALKNTTDHPTETLCKMLNSEFKNRFSDFPNFDTQKKNVKPVDPTDEYYIAIQINSTTGKLVPNILEDKVNDPVFLRYFSANSLLNVGLIERPDPELREFVSISSAIQQLSYRKAFQPFTDSAFGRVLDIYVGELLTNKTSAQEKFFNFDHNPQLRNMDQHFLSDSLLKEDYEKIKKDTIARLSQLRKSSH